MKVNIEMVRSSSSSCSRDQAIRMKVEKGTEQENILNNLFQANLYKKLE